MPEMELELLAAWTKIITIGERHLFIPGLRQIPGDNDFGAWLLDHFGIGVRHRRLARTSRAFQLVGHEVHQNQAFLLGAIGRKLADRLEVCPAAEEEQAAAVIAANVTFSRDDTSGLGRIPDHNHQDRDQNKAQPFRFHGWKPTVNLRGAFYCVV